VRDQAAGKKIAVTALYCSFLPQWEREQSTAKEFCAILKQGVSREGIPRHMQEAVQKDKNEFGG